MAHTPLFRALLRALQQARRANLTSAGRPAPTSGVHPRLTRRQLLHGAVAAGAAAAAAPFTGPLQPAQGKAPRPRIAI